MKSEWKTKRLIDICLLFTDGDWIESKDQSSDGIRLIQTGNIGEGQFRDRDEKARYISESTFKLLKCTEVFEGDCLISRLPDPVGRACILPNTGKRMITAVDCTILRFDQKQIIPKFFNYYSQSCEYLRTTDSETTGTTRKRISRNKLGQIEIPIPPLIEQQRIVAILDEGFKSLEIARTNAEKNLQKVRELYEAYLLTIFSQRDQLCVKKTLKEISHDFGRGKSKHRPRNDPKLYGGNYPFIQTGDVRNSKHLITTYSQTYNDIGLAQSKLWPKGTLCITIAANIAETGILDFDACFPDSVIGVVVNEKLTSNKYLEYLLQSLKSELQAKGKGSAQDNINLATFENQLFPFPDIETQQYIVTKLDNFAAEIQRLDIIYQQKIRAFDELKKSLLYKAFNGEL